MKLPSLFGKKPSPEEIEREVTEEIEALVRAGDKPPPPSWTLAGGLPLENASAEVPADAPAATADAPAPTAEVADEDDVAPPAPSRAAPKRSRSNAARSTAKPAAGNRKARAGSAG